MGAELLEYCSFFDKRYLARGLCLYESLLRHSPPFRLRVLCLDDKTHDVLETLGLASIELVRLEEVEAFSPEVAAVKRERDLLDYYLTVKPAFFLFCLQGQPSDTLVTYLEADLFFFDDPSPVYEEIGTASIAVTPHHYAAGVSQAAGLFNAGWLCFRNDPLAIAICQRWLNQCVEWCATRFEVGQYADQRYLDDWPQIEGVRVIQNPGANIGPWSMAGREPYAADDGSVMLAGSPLVFYHFSHVARINRWVYSLSLGDFGAQATRAIMSLIYEPYIRRYETELNRLRPFGVDLQPLIPGLVLGNWTRLPRGPQIRSLARSLLHIFRGTIGGGYVYLWHGQRVLEPAQSRADQAKAGRTR